jgi:hypothetical protein
MKSSAWPNENGWVEDNFLFLRGDVFIASAEDEWPPLDIVLRRSIR